MSQLFWWGRGTLLLWASRLGWGAWLGWGAHHLWGAWLPRGAWLLAGGLLPLPRRLPAAGLVVLAPAPRHQAPEAHGEFILGCLLLCFRLRWSRGRRRGWWLGTRACLFPLLASSWVLRGFDPSAQSLSGAPRLLSRQHPAHHLPHCIRHFLPGQARGLHVWAFC